MSDQSGGDRGAPAPQKRVVKRKSKKFGALYCDGDPAERPGPPNYDLYRLDVDTTAKALDDIASNPEMPDGQYTIVQICSEPKVKRTVTKSELV